MNMSRTEIYDVIGIGFGPSNLALAIALEERDRLHKVRFLEARTQFAWHPDMMIPGTDMQVSFMKDLVSMRNPRSKFSFVSYLHDKGRLSRFINRKTFFPSREEFNDYFGWVAEQLPVCNYDNRVVAVEPVEHAGRVTKLAVIAENADGTRQHYHTRSLVLAPGGQPFWPECFKSLRSTGHIIHSQDYLSSIADRLKPGMRVAVIGGGQSAAEIFADLAARPAAPEVEIILRGRALIPSDDTPFVNEVFDHHQTETFHARPEKDRNRLLKDLAATNYSVVDADLIEQIYEMLYEQDVRGDNKLTFTSETHVSGGRLNGSGLELDLVGPEGTTGRNYDLVILGTGYRRNLDDTVLKDITSWRTGEPDRDYRLPMTDKFLPAIFLQGYSETTHGLSDTLLSVLSFRSEEIALALEAYHFEEAKVVAAE